ncbi:MAG: hypothetical protein Q8M81_06540 [Sediminibacterium sp.]|nr:hypothetical protein [Sediminibacterium sp.]
MKASFGKLVRSFVMIVWGPSSGGKSNFIMQIIRAFMPYGKVLYISLEEGTEASIVEMVKRHLSEDEHSGKVEFADHTMTYDALFTKLEKKQSPLFIVIDSLQYWNITIDQYKKLKERFKNKAFIFISHAAGKVPDGRVADKIRYDAGIKIRIEGFVAFIGSRYGGNKPYVIWEEGAKKYWGKKFRSVVTGVNPPKEKKPSKKQIKTEEEETPKTTVET